MNYLKCSSRERAIVCTVEGSPIHGICQCEFKFMPVVPFLCTGVFRDVSKACLQVADFLPPNHSSDQVSFLPHLYCLHHPVSEEEAREVALTDRLSTRRWMIHTRNRSIDCRGHAVGAGCVFALAHDYRLMSSELGYIFMNEVNVYINLRPAWRSLSSSNTVLALASLRVSAYRSH